MDAIVIEGARTHNLRDLHLTLPRGKLIVITGLSGSGKSSLAFDTLYAEGQRRYVESLSAYARQFLSMMDKPDVDHIEGLSPAIAIEQKSTSHNPRSTVGTVTEIHDYLRLLFARAGTPHCPDHGHALEAQSVSGMVDQILAQPGERRFMLLAPRIHGRRGEHREVFADLRNQGFVRARVDGEVVDLDDVPALDPQRSHDIEVVVDRFRVRPDLATRLADSLETCLALGDDVARLADMDDATRDELVFSARYACPECGYSLSELEPRLFSFNNPQGACPTCDGLGVEQFFDPARIVAHPELSLAAGAVRGWDRRNAYYGQIINDLAAHYGFDVDTPWRDLPASIRDIVLYGSGDEVIRFHYAGARRGSDRASEHPFEGVVNNMSRRYRETDSAAVRDELARYLTRRTCPDCGGSRLNAAARHVTVADWTLADINALSIAEAARAMGGLDLTGARATIAESILREIDQRLRFLVNVGLDYLSLERSAETLSGGEAQRIRLASQIGAGLVGVMYVLDEPSIGLHQRDNDRLLDTLRHLRDLDNTVIVVEHDEEAIRAADHIVDMGPGAGSEGGAVIAAGDAEAVMRAPDSLTGDYLAGRRRIAVPAERLAPDDARAIHIRGARGHNLQAVDAAFPAGLMIGVTGVSGSGKSTLINDTLYPAAAAALNGAELTPADCEAVDGLAHFDKVVDIDQSPIGRTPRSNPATYTGLFTPIRELFAATAEARSRGYGPGRFSFNVRGGRCEACQGEGVIRVAMHFLPDVYVPCDTCRGARYNRETLEIRYRGYSIAEVLDMSVAEALAVFSSIPALARKLQTLIDVGLGYVRLGQNAVTLSGGEAQRVKLARELSRRGTGQTLYILDEPTTGLHFHDIAQLLEVLHRLRDEGNTLVVIEHNLDVIKTCDWLIDLGPEGGAGGGRIVATGTPEAVAADPRSHTGRYLAPLLERTARA
ncbi:excinuclease ABC subunit UvrA [Spiribacter onubensis]|uniref:UvrABC system protein A n=1 Tax=Spiribacter onubensis TaxID=3122420 RepID=A0ABV3S5L7_9GAMM